MTVQDLLAQLNQGTTLTQLQTYVQEVITLRGFAEETSQEVLLMLMEEVGELAKAVRKQQGMFVDPAKLQNYDTVQSEVADIMILLLSLCNVQGINLMDAVVAKEKINAQRTWERSTHGQ